MSGAKLPAWAALGAEARALARIGLFAFGLLLTARLAASRLIEPEWIVLAAGVLGDAFAAAAVAGACALLNLASSIAARTLLVAFALLTAMNLEHIYALDDVLRPAVAEHAFDWHFAVGTAANLLTWPFMVLAVGLSLVLPRLRPAADRTAAAAAAALALAASVPLAVANTASAYSWREGNPTALAVAKLLPAGNAPAAGGSGLQRDLSGTLAYARRPAGQLPNVLVLVLEGIPGIYLEQVQQQVGFSTDISMPKLSAFAQEGLIVPNFISHEVGTIFGTYAIHCGDYGKGNAAKLKTLDLLAPAERPQCLPGALASVGYHTAYLQAADLAFMDKDRMVPNLGFLELEGMGATDETTLSENFWGAEDGKLYEVALKRIRDLHAQGRPWMMSILNVGTHHPYSAPKDYLDRHESPKAAAVAYLDDILAPFLAALESEGLLENTAVVISSDESHGVPGHPLSRNWGIFAVRAPGIDPGIQPGLFGQVDVMVSVLDYLGLADIAPAAQGRSIFRTYPATRQRTLLFSDSASHGSNEFFTCGSSTCQLYAATGPGLMSAAYRRSEAEGPEAASLLRLRNDALARSYNLMDSRSQPLIAVFGETLTEPGARIEHRIDQHANSILALSLEAFNRGPELVHMRFAMQRQDGLPMSSKQPILALGTLAPGMGVRANLGFRTEEDLSGLLAMHTSAGQDARDLEIRRLVLTATPGSESGQRFSSWVRDAQMFYEKTTDSSIWQLPSGRSLFANVVSEVFEKHFSGESDMGLLLPAVGPSARYEMGTEASLAKGSFWGYHLYLHNGWEMPEAGGVAMAGANASLLMYLDEVNQADSYRLTLDPLPGTSLDQVQVYVGDLLAGTLRAAAGEPSALTFPGQLLRTHAVNLFQLSAGQTPSAERGISAFKLEPVAQEAS